MSSNERPLVWLHGEIQTPPFSRSARIQAGYLLRLLQKGEPIAMPHARPLATVGPRCHELRVRDAAGHWRVVYRLDPDAVVIVAVFSKKTASTPRAVIDACIHRLKEYDRA